MLAVVAVLLLLAGALAGLSYFIFRKRLRRAKAIERGLKMVPLLIHLPPPSDDTQVGSRSMQDVLKDKISQAEVLYGLLGGTAMEGFKSRFYGQRHVAMELVAYRGMIYYYAAVPVAMVDVVQKAIITAYPGARVEEAEDHNIFNTSGRLSGTIGGELVLKADYAYPIQTFRQLERDPMEAVINALSSLPDGDGAAIQFLIRPAGRRWTKHPLRLIKKKRRITTSGFGPKDLALAAVKSPEQRQQEMAAYNQRQPLTGVEQAVAEAMEEKVQHPGFETVIRVVVSTESATRSQAVLASLTNAFALYESPGLNGFRFLPAADSQGLVTAFIFRFFPPGLRGGIFNTVELATLFHLPDSQFTPVMNVDRQMSKQVDGPPQLPSQGLLLGYNVFRGVKKEIRLSAEDRRRHTYIIGQTGTGKSTMLENLITQDMLAGNGFAFIDPHGDTAEKILGLVPKERAEDVIYFNPADMEYPLGLNLFEFERPEQKDFLIQETIGMLYKLYDPGHTGIIGPRYEHWFRNAALTLMSDPEGSTFIEIPKVFTDTEYLKRKFRYLSDPTVIDFWTKEMAQTSDYHKSEMLGWFVSKFGAFQNNEMMRNILGQTKSAFNLRDVMDNKKILIVNLSKGRLGELNSQLLGMIFVIKFQAAAMGRTDLPEEQRNDFCLYVDEFQNFSTDSFASILSEARKYRLNLVVANQFIGQLSDQIRDAVFGNIGTIITHRIGPEDAEFMTKQFAPVFETRDLVNVPNYNSVVKLLVGGLPSQPFSMQDLPPLGTSNAELGLAVKQLSAAKFGQARTQVETDILARLMGKAAVPAAGTVPAAGSGPLTAGNAVRPAGSPPAAATQPAVAVTPPVPREALQTNNGLPPVPPATRSAAQPATPQPAAPQAAQSSVPDARPKPPVDGLSIQDIVKSGGAMTAPVAPTGGGQAIAGSGEGLASQPPKQPVTPPINPPAMPSETVVTNPPVAASSMPAPAPAPAASPAAPEEPLTQITHEAQSEIDELLGTDALHTPDRQPLSQAAPELLKDQPQAAAEADFIKPLADQPAPLRPPLPEPLGNQRPLSEEPAPAAQPTAKPPAAAPMPAMQPFDMVTSLSPAPPAPATPPAPSVSSLKPVTEAPKVAPEPDLSKPAPIVPPPPSKPAPTAPLPPKPVPVPSLPVTQPVEPQSHPAPVAKTEVKPVMPAAESKPISVQPTPEPPKPAPVPAPEPPKPAPAAPPAAPVKPAAPPPEPPKPVVIQPLAQSGQGTGSEPTAHNLQPAAFTKPVELPPDPPKPVPGSVVPPPPGPGQESSVQVGAVVQPAKPSPPATTPPLAGVGAEQKSEAKPDIPNLAPGEVYVADDGTVYTG